MGGRGPSAKVCLSAKCCVLAFKASLQYPGSPLPKYPHLPSVLYWYSRHLCSICWGAPLAKLGSSAKIGVLVFKASMINSLTGGSICQSIVHLSSCVYWYSRQISPVRLEISYCHLGVVSGVFWPYFGVFWGIKGSYI